MHLHLERARHQRAVEVARGIFAAFTKGELGRIWFDAIATDEREVNELHYRTNADRKTAAVKQRFGFPTA